MRARGFYGVRLGSDAQPFFYNGPPIQNNQCENN